MRNRLSPESFGSWETFGDVMFNPWFGFSFQAARLGWETQNVMARRLMRLAGGGPAAQPDALPDTEKTTAVAKAHTAKAGVAVAGRRKRRDVAKKVLRIHKKRVR